MRRIALWVGVASIVLSLEGGVSPASADAPTRESIPFALSGVDRTTCGFPILWSATGTWEVTTFVDADGEWRSTITRWQGTEIDVNKKTGTSITGSWREIDLTDAGSLVVVGPIYSFPVPGQGNVMLETGRFVLDLQTGEWVFAVGRTDWSSGNVAGWCAALS